MLELDEWRVRDVKRQVRAVATTWGSDTEGTAATETDLTAAEGQQQRHEEINRIIATLLG